MKRHHCAVAVLLVAVCLFAAPVIPRATAQNDSRNQSQASGPTPPGGELAKETREAAGEEEENGQLKHSAAVRLVGRLTGLDARGAYWVCLVANFVIIAGLLYGFTRKSLPAFFRARTIAIQKAMEEARRASEEARQRLSRVEARLSRLDAEIVGMRTDAEKEAVAEEERIKSAASEEARHILASAEQEIAAAAKAARRDLTAYAADLAVALAAKQIHVDPPTDQSLVRNFSQQLGVNGSVSRKDVK